MKLESRVSIAVDVATAAIFGSLFITGITWIVKNPIDWSGWVLVAIAVAVITFMLLGIYRVVGHEIWDAEIRGLEQGLEDGREESLRVYLSQSNIDKLREAIEKHQQRDE